MHIPHKHTHVHIHTQTHTHISTHFNLGINMEVLHIIYIYIYSKQSFISHFTYFFSLRSSCDQSRRNTINPATRGTYRIQDPEYWLHLPYGLWRRPHCQLSFHWGYPPGIRGLRVVLPGQADNGPDQLH